MTDAQTNACTWDVYYADMAITGTDGTVTPIYDRESAVSLQYYGSAGITNDVAAAERSNTADDAIQPANTTTYYVGDQINSTRMLLAAGGWPAGSIKGDVKRKHFARSVGGRCFSDIEPLLAAAILFAGAWFSFLLS